MDGGERERRKAEELKVIVKRKANERRERRWEQVAAATETSPRRHNGRRLVPDLTQSVDVERIDGGDTSPIAAQAGAKYTMLDTASSINAGTCPDDKSEQDIRDTLIYLDYVVPFQFPFYCPSLLESSRGWLLVRPMKNKALHHTALSLASYFSSVLFDAVDGGHETCKRESIADLENQQELSIKAL
ncbi:hypothetical protein F5Y15DRAFT_420712 [Xylariaceae sp. FL0016]|nr:hypothetical protein F5Y15DRAFT_420712 [Xylariaceae sp. FL0016]